MSNLDDEREDRQYDLMARRLDGFRSGEIGIGQALADLRGLLNALEGAPEQWVDAFKQEWNVLELDYAVALDHQTPLPTASDPAIAEALEELDHLVRLRRGQSPD